MKRKSIIFALFIGGILLLGATIRGRGQDATTQTRSEYTSFGMVGLSHGQTIRLNVVHAAVAENRLPPNPCLVELNFVDDAGNTIAQSTEVLRPGQATLLDVNGDDLLGRNLRSEVRAFIRVITDGRENQLPPNPCIPTLAVFENATGKTTLIHPGTVLKQQITTASP
jgi:hypothetical protein